VRLLYLDPYHGGSHAAFVDGWRAHSRHRWTVLTLPPRHWRWRMRHTPLTLSRAVAEQVANGAAWDALVCTDMVDLAAFRGLCPTPVAALPALAYFHENQLTYPVQEPRNRAACGFPATAANASSAGDESARTGGRAARETAPLPAEQAQARDLHFAYTNVTTALAADACWFNSRYHLDAFTGALAAWLSKMPDFRHPEVVAEIRAKAAVFAPGIAPFPPRPPRPAGPLRLLWAARWEYDKGPEELLAALTRAAAAGVPFRLAVIGEEFANHPAAFATIRNRFAERIDHWGFQSSRAGYRACLAWADVVLSTARHEFFGLAVAEAVAAGCLPLLPDRLAYPERYAHHDPPFLYDPTPAGLAAAIGEAATRLHRPAGVLWGGDPEAGRGRVADLLWPTHAPRLDAAVEAITAATSAD